MTDKQKTFLYKKLIESVSSVMMKHLNELSIMTIKKAAEKITKRNDKLLFKDEDGKYQVNKKELKNFLSGKPEAVRQRYLKMLKDGTLAEYLLKQKDEVKL